MLLWRISEVYAQKEICENYMYIKVAFVLFFHNMLLIAEIVQFVAVESDFYMKTSVPNV